jgi:hypothetical protein
MAAAGGAFAMVSSSRVRLSRTCKKLAEVKAEGEEALVKAADDVEDEGRDRFTEITKILGELLVATTVFDDGEVALREGAD